MAGFQKAEESDRRQGSGRNMLPDFYKRQWNWIHRKAHRLFLFSLGLFMVAALVSHYYFARHPALALKAFTRLSEILSQKISPDAAGFDLFFQIFLNNLQAGTLFFLLGFIPFLFIPAAGILVNGIQIGLVSSVTLIQGKPLAKVFLFGILPHGLFEIPALLFACTLGLYISIQILKKVLDLDKEKIPFVRIMTKTAAVWATVVLPLIVAGAMIEAFITPLLIKAFL